MRFPTDTTVDLTVRLPDLWIITVSRVSNLPGYLCFELWVSSELSLKFAKTKSYYFTFLSNFYDFCSIDSLICRSYSAGRTQKKVVTVANKYWTMCVLTKKCPSKLIVWPTAAQAEGRGFNTFGIYVQNGISNVSWVFADGKHRAGTNIHLKDHLIIYVRPKPLAARGGRKYLEWQCIDLLYL